METQDQKAHDQQAQNADPGADDLTLDPGRLSAASVRWVRLSFAISGVIAAVLGILLLIVPGWTITLAAVLLGIHFIVLGVVRLGLAIFGRLPGSQHRVLQILLGLLMLFAGIVILRDSAAAATTLLLIVVIFAGVGWIIDGIMSIVESQRASSRGWAITYGVLSLLAGIVVLVIPGWSIVWLIIFAAISLIVLGVTGIVRAMTFKRHTPSNT